MGLQKTIYIPTKEAWEAIQKAAAGQDKSVSAYLIWCHEQRFYKNLVELDTERPKVYARPVDVEGVDLQEYFRPHSKDQQARKKAKK